GQRNLQAPRRSKMNLGRRSFLKSAAVLAAPGVPTTAFGDGCTDDGTLINIGLKKQLFFGNVLIESVQDITREFHQAERAKENPLIFKDRPWEHVLLVRTSSYCGTPGPQRQTVQVLVCRRGIYE